MEPCETKDIRIPGLWRKGFAPNNIRGDVVWEFDGKDHWWLDESHEAQIELIEKVLDEHGD